MPEFEVLIYIEHRARVEVEASESKSEAFLHATMEEWGELRCVPAKRSP